MDGFSFSKGTSSVVKTVFDKQSYPFSAAELS